jgi:2'-5' RNA ligase
VLALHLDDAGVITELAAAVERALMPLGFAPEERSFRPHVTLARLREPADLRRRLAAAYEPSVKGGRISALTLYESELGGEAPVYTALARAQFPAP